MSLIEEALRRVQDPLLKAAKAAHATTTPVPAPASHPTAPVSSETPLPAVKNLPVEDETVITPQAHSWPTTPPSGVTLKSARPPSNQLLVAVAASVLALAIVSFAGGAFWLAQRFGTWGVTPSAQKPASQHERAKSAADHAATPRAPQSTPAPQTGTDAFILSGVVEGLGKPYAVVNGQVVAVGDRVEGATLLRIANGMITLRLADGSEQVLRVSR